MASAIIIVLTGTAHILAGKTAVSLITALHTNVRNNWGIYGRKAGINKKGVKKKCEVRKRLPGP